MCAATAAKPGSVVPRSTAGVDFDRFESLASRVVAGLVPATSKFEARRMNNRGGRDKPGHDGMESGSI
jgi:hypothetical protein